MFSNKVRDVVACTTLALASFPALSGCAGLQRRGAGDPDTGTPRTAYRPRIPDTGLKNNVISGGQYVPSKETVDTWVKHIEKMDEGQLLSEVSTYSTRNDVPRMKALLVAIDQSQHIETYVKALKCVKDTGATPEMQNVWLDVIQREDLPTRFVWSLKVAEAGGLELLIGFAQRRPEETEKVAARVEETHWQKLGPVHLPVKKGEKRPNVANAMRAAAEDATKAEKATKAATPNDVANDVQKSPRFRRST